MLQIFVPKKFHGLRAVIFTTMGTAFFAFSFACQAECLSPWGMPIQNGEVVTAYLNPQATPGMGCNSEVRVCLDDQLSGSYQFQSCQENQGCYGPMGYVPEGGSVTAYLNPVEQNGGQCQSEMRVCSLGILSGSYPFTSCTEIP